MQAATTGDVYTYTAYETDGVTPMNMTGYSAVTLAIQNPLGQVTTYSPTVAIGANVTFTFVTTPTMFPTAGVYKLQFVIDYTGGTESKTRVDTVTIEASID